MVSQKIKRFEPLMWVALAMLFFLVIWPTPYIYQKFDGTYIRTNKITGVNERSTQHGWKVLTNEQLDAMALRSR